MTSSVDILLWLRFNYWKHILGLQIFKTRQGQVIIYQNFTYSRCSGAKHRLRCSRAYRGKCKAQLKTDDEGNVIFAYNNHNHPPPGLILDNKTSKVYSL